MNSVTVKEVTDKAAVTLPDISPASTCGWRKSRVQTRYCTERICIFLNHPISTRFAG